MIPQPAAPAQAPAYDRFIIYDDASAIVESRSGTFYALQFFDRPDGHRVPHCECEAARRLKPCRHRPKLKALLDAPARVEAVYGQAVICKGDGWETVIERRCPECREFIVECWIRVTRSKMGHSGFLPVQVCGCADWAGKVRKTI